MEMPFGITREEVLELAVNRIISEFDGSALCALVNNRIRENVEKEFAKGVPERIDAFLTEEMTLLLGKEIVPVSIWGESTGSPTTIREQLEKRARDFWGVRVNDEGKESSYGGVPRSEALMKKILQDEFAKAVKDNAEVIVGAFKAALKADSTKLVSDHIDKLINVKSR